jgi:hypothetical protein
MKDAFFVIQRSLHKSVKIGHKENIKFYRGHLEGVGHNHQLDVVLREVELLINVNDIPTDDEPDVAPKLECMYFSDANYFFILSTYCSLICWFEVVMPDRALLSHLHRATYIHRTLSNPIWTEHFSIIHTGLPTYIRHGAGPIWTILLSVC